MKLYLFLFLLTTSGGFAQTDAVFKVSKPAPPKVDTSTQNSSSAFYLSTNYAPLVQDSFVTAMSAINYTTNELDRILQLPLEQSVISCELIYDSSGKAAKLSWSANDSGTWAAMQRLIDSKPKGKFTFANIYVANGRKKRKLADKTIEVK
jgi:hypothetical protein